LFRFSVTEPSRDGSSTPPSCTSCALGVFCCSCKYRYVSEYNDTRMTSSTLIVGELDRDGVGDDSRVDAPFQE
jgi:hypothetical protein